MLDLILVHSCGADRQEKDDGHPFGYALRFIPYLNNRGRCGEEWITTVMVY